MLHLCTLCLKVSKGGSIYPPPPPPPYSSPPSALQIENSRVFVNWRHLQTVCGGHLRPRLAYSSYGQVWTSILYISHFFSQLMITVTSLHSLPCMSILLPSQYSLSHVIHSGKSSCVMGARRIIMFSRSCDTRARRSPTSKTEPELGIVQYFKRKQDCAVMNKTKIGECSSKNVAWGGIKMCLRGHRAHIWRSSFTWLSILGAFVVDMWF